LSINDIIQELKNKKNVFFDSKYTAKLKQILTAYKNLYEQSNALDPEFTQTIIDNPFVQLLKHGIIEKRSDGVFNSWEERLLILTDAGLIYFKKGSDQPQKYKALNNFIV
jgi:hypothetical protein